jgi:hypothetical protein
MYLVVESNTTQVLSFVYESSIALPKVKLLTYNYQMLLLFSASELSSPLSAGKPEATLLK